MNLYAMAAVWGHPCTANTSFLVIFYVYFQGANTIKQIKGLDKLPSMTTLHLRDNQLEHLDGFTDALCSLQYVNVR